MGHAQVRPDCGTLASDDTGGAAGLRPAPATACARPAPPPSSRAAARVSVVSSKGLSATKKYDHSGPPGRAGRACPRTAGGLWPGRSRCTTRGPRAPNRWRPGHTAGSRRPCRAAPRGRPTSNARCAGAHTSGQPRGCRGRSHPTVLVRSPYVCPPSTATRASGTTCLTSPASGPAQAEGGAPFRQPCGEVAGAHRGSREQQPLRPLDRAIVEQVHPHDHLAWGSTTSTTTMASHTSARNIPIVATTGSTFPPTCRDPGRRAAAVKATPRSRRRRRRGTGAARNPGAWWTVSRSGPGCSGGRPPPARG